MFGMPKSYQKESYKEPHDRLKANISTSLGDFVVELYAKECPETVWNFVNLAEGRQMTERTETSKKGFYEGIIFHRVIKGFMIQCGCPDGRGSGGPGYTFKDEFNMSLKHNSDGILSMANRGPGTNGSQFFITLGATPHLDGRHTVFGKVVEGMDVIKKIGSTRTGPQDRPVEDVVINQVTIIRPS